MLMICMSSFSIYDSVLHLSASVLAIGRISTQHAVLLPTHYSVLITPASVLAIDKDPLYYSLLLISVSVLVRA